MTFPIRLLGKWLFSLCFYSFIHNYIFIIKSKYTLFTFSQDALDYSNSVLLQKDKNLYKNRYMKQHNTSLQIQEILKKKVPFDII